MINNTDEEILDAVKDMNLSLDKQYNIGKEEILLRCKFDKLIIKNTALDLQKSRICYSFLKKYNDLLC